MHAKTLIKKARSLPVANGEEWAIGQRTIDISIRELGEHERPEFVICISPDKGAIGAQVFAQETPNTEVTDWVIGCMVSPMAGSPRRQGAVTLTGGKLAHLQYALEQLGIRVSVTASLHPAIDELATGFEEAAGAPGLPSYKMETDYEDTDIIEAFFESAAEYHRQKPWKCFEHDVGR